MLPSYKALWSMILITGADFALSFSVPHLSLISGHDIGIVSRTFAQECIGLRRVRTLLCDRHRKMHGRLYMSTNYKSKSDGGFDLLGGKDFDLLSFRSFYREALLRYCRSSIHHSIINLMTIDHDFFSSDIQI
jgi:hypothetical protein